MFLAIDESVLLRNVGGERIAAEQLEDLAELAANNPRVTVRVVSLTQPQGAIVGTLSSFVLMSLSDDDTDDSILYRERFREDYIDHDPERIGPYRDAFERLWEAALPEEATLRAIRAAALQRQVHLDRLPASGE